MSDNQQPEQSIEELKAEIQRLKVERERRELEAERDSLTAQLQRPSPMGEQTIAYEPVQPRGPPRQTGMYDRLCGNCNRPLSGFSMTCLSCGQGRVGLPQPSNFTAANYGQPPVEPLQALNHQQQRQGSRHPPRRQQNNRGRRAAPFQGPQLQAEPRSSQWVAPGMTRAPFIPQKWDGKFNYKIEKKIAVAHNRADVQRALKKNDRDLNAIKKAVAEKEAEKEKKEMKEKVDDPVSEDQTRDGPQYPNPDPPIKKENMGDESEHEKELPV